MKLLKSLLMSAISIPVLFIFSQGVFAATSDTSAATVQFTQDGDPGSQLTLDDTPDLNFGTQFVSLTPKTYTTSTVNPFVQVTDERSDSYATGWNVTVSASPFILPNIDILEGANIKFLYGSVSQSPDLGFGAPTPVTPITLTTDNTSTPVVSAAAHKGRGTWKTGWTNTNVTLNVGAGTMDAGSYSSTLTWILGNTP